MSEIKAGDRVKINEDGGWGAGTVKFVKCVTMINSIPVSYELVGSAEEVNGSKRGIEFSAHEITLLPPEVKEDM